MYKKPIANSPGYSITTSGEVYNDNNVKMKTWLSSDGYVRIRLPSNKHGKRVNRTVHLLVAEAFLNTGKYAKRTKLQINHIDGNKLNNDLSNLEEVTGTRNVNHAHDNALYTYDLPVRLRDIIEHKSRHFRSLRELARYFNVSLNYVRHRVRVSQTYPLNGRYVLSVDYGKYIKHVSTIKNTKKIYVYDHVACRYFTLTAYAQISILLGISYINIGKKLLRFEGIVWYTAGYSFSMTKIVNPDTVRSALADRLAIWKKTAVCDRIT